MGTFTASFKTKTMDEHNYALIPPKENDSLEAEFRGLSMHQKNEKKIYSEKSSSVGSARSIPYSQKKCRHCRVPKSSCQPIRIYCPCPSVRISSSAPSSRKSFGILSPYIRSSRGEYFPTFDWRVASNQASSIADSLAGLVSGLHIKEFPKTDNRKMLKRLGG